MDRFMNKSGKILLITVFLLGALGGTIISLGVTASDETERATYIEKLQIFNGVLGYVRDFYVEEEEDLDPEKNDLRCY
ncbi:MAG: hypothetical protein ACLFN5_00965 [bacterium]